MKMVHVGFWWRRQKGADGRAMDDDDDDDGDGATTSPSSSIDRSIDRRTAGTALPKEGGKEGRRATHTAIHPPSSLEGIRR